MDEVEIVRGIRDEDHFYPRIKCEVFKVAELYFSARSEKRKLRKFVDNKKPLFLSNSVFF